MRGFGALCCAVALLVAAAAGAAEQVRVRVGEHPGFSRLVFDWGKSAGARVEQAAGRVTLRFDRPGELDLSRYRADPPPEVPQISVEPGSDTLTVILTTVLGARLRLFEDEGNTVLDVMRPESPQNAPADKEDDRPSQAKKKKRAADASLLAQAPRVPIPERKPAPSTLTGNAAQTGPEAGEPAASPVSLLAARPESKPELAEKAPESARVPIPVRKPTPPKLAGKTPQTGNEVVDPAVPATSLLAARPAPGPAEKPPAAAGSVPISLLPPGTPEPSPQKQKPDAAEKKAAPERTAKAPKPKAKPDFQKLAARLRSAEPSDSKPKVRGTPDTATAAASTDTASPGTASPGADVPNIKDGALVSAVPAPVVINTAPAPARTFTRNAPGALRFAWDSIVSAAAYRRGPHLWLVFDHAPPAGLIEMVKKTAPELAPAVRSDVTDATVLRLTLPSALVPELIREGTTWIVELRARPPLDGIGIEVEVDAGVKSAEVLFHVAGPGRTVSFTDPDTGSRIIVVPVATAGQGLPVTREFPQFRALASRQGVVIQPLSEGIQVAVAPGIVQVSDAEGLIVSYGSSLARLRSNVPTESKGPRMFDLAAWRRGGADHFRLNKHQLQNAAAQAETKMISVARLDLARFYFAHGLSVETLGVLQLRESADPRLDQDPEVRLIKAVSAFLTENYEAAAAGLYHPSLAGEWEAELWQAALAAVSLDWSLAADAFTATEELMAAYPHSVRTRLRLLAAEARLGIDDPQGADRYLEQARQDNPNHAEEAQIAFLVGRRLQLEGEVETAKALWQRVAKSTHPPSRARARLVLLDMALESGSLEMAEAIAALERLRFEWRGDQFEYALLQRLGDIYISSQRYRDGLDALRQAASHFPNSERSQTVTQRMSDVFTELYLGNASAQLPPLRALVIYQEFKELTPAGARGDELITRLADRLVDVDLLDRAAEVLESQIQYRLQGPEKARVGARLAVVRLLDQEPAKALHALTMSEAPNLPDEMVRERRHLHVRALAALDRTEEALAVLGADDNPAALRLRTEVLWGQQNWAAVAVLLGQVVPETPPAERPLSEIEAEDVVNLVVALTMIDDRGELLRLGTNYKEAMAQGPHRETFTLLVGDLEPGRIKTIAEELAQVEQVEAFLASYRKRLQQVNLSQLN